MQRYAFFTIVLLCGLLYAGCGEETYAVSIINKTSKSVSYSYNGKKNTLKASTNKKYTVKAYTQPPSDIVDENGIMSVKMTDQQGETYTFTDAPSIRISAINTLTEKLGDVTIKAGNYIDNDGSSRLTIPAGETKTAKIYTEKPKFTVGRYIEESQSMAELNSSVTVDWKIIEDKVKKEKTMYITIK